MMDDFCAPQWADFTRSPQIFSDNYFDVEHEVHEPQMHIKSPSDSISSLSCKENAMGEQSMSETKFHDSLEPQTPVCANVAYFVPHDNKKHTTEGAKESNLCKSMKNLKLDDKSNQIQQTWNISITELTSGLKLSTEELKMRAAVPERLKNYVRMQETKNTVLGKSSSKKVQANDNRKKNKTQKASTKVNVEQLAQSKENNCGEDDASEKRLSFKVVSAPRRQSNLFKNKTKVLTCQYRRKSLMKYRRCSNQFVSMAEAVAKFQTGTPQRFRTMSNKDAKPGPLMKVKHSPLKLTCPVSPALRCKQRKRNTTILTQQEREQLEIEEMKKHFVKANPVPVHVLKGPPMLKKVNRKPLTVTEEVHLTQPKKTRHTTGLHTSMQQNTNDNGQKNVANMTRSHSATSITKKECAEPVTEPTKPIPFSFEARNKEFRMKKEEKLKILHDQEINKVKAEFHARPAPKFSKATHIVKEQSNKKFVTPCPFSFEERNKTLAKKKEELLKQIQEKNKKQHVFHANPVPNFKLSSKEKEKSINSCKEVLPRQTKSCNDQENKQPNIMAGDKICADKKKKETKEHIVNKETDKKQCKTNTEEGGCKNEKQKAVQKRVVKFELNTDKRAKERQEFEEKVKKKEHELEEKRHEEEKNRLLKEKMERAELRKIAEVKARPMPVYKPMVTLKSTKPVTNPQSPAWASRTKPKYV